MLLFNFSSWNLGMGVVVVLVRGILMDVVVVLVRGI